MISDERFLRAILDSLDAELLEMRQFLESLRPDDDPAEAPVICDELAA